MTVHSHLVNDLSAPTAACAKFLCNSYGVAPPVGSISYAGGTFYARQRRVPCSTSFFSAPVSPCSAC